MAAASIEIIIRARDEASRVVADTMKKIVAETESAKRAAARGGTGGVGTAGGLGDAFSMAARTPQMRAIGEAVKQGERLYADYAGAVAEATRKQIDFNEALRGTSAAPFVEQIREANRVIEEYEENAKTRFGRIQNLWNNLNIAAASRPINRAEAQRARAEQEAAVRNEAEGLQQLRETQQQRALAQAGKYEAERRAALQAGDAAAAAIAKKNIDDVAEYRLQKARESLEREEDVRRKAFTQYGAKVPEAVESDIGERRQLLEERFAEESAERATRSAQQERQLAEEVAARRRGYALQEIQDARAVEVARIEAAARVGAAEAERRHDYRAALQAQLDGIAQVRAAQVQAIQESATARAQAAQGPGREEEVLAVRKAEAAAIVQLNVQTAEQVTAAWARSAEARKQHARQVADAERELAAALRAEQPNFAAEATRIQGVLAQSPGRGFDENRANLERALLATQQEARQQQEEDSRTAEEERRRRVDTARTRLAELQPGGGAGAQIAGEGAALKVTRDAAGNVTIANQFEQAAVTAGKLTDKVKELGGALKDLQVSPGFAAKLSQDLADTLTFLGARSP